MKGRVFRVGAALMIAVLVLAGLMMAMSGAAPVVAAPEQALYWCGGNTWCQWTVQSGDGITASAASENYIRQGASIVYNRAEVYSTVDISDAQTVTVKFQYSADGSNWLDHSGGGLAAQTADGTTAISITNLGGTYWRAYATVGTTATVTPTIILVFKRTQ